MSKKHDTWHFLIKQGNKTTETQRVTECERKNKRSRFKKIEYYEWRYIHISEAHNWYESLKSQKRSARKNTRNELVTSSKVNIKIMKTKKHVTPIKSLVDT